MFMFMFYLFVIYVVFVVVVLNSMWSRTYRSYVIIDLWISFVVLCFITSYSIEIMYHIFLHWALSFMK